MVFAAESAVAIKSRDGRNLLLQCRGIDMQLAKQAVEEAINLLRMAAKGADAWDVQSATQGLPMLCGKLEVVHKRYSVTYRVVGHVVVLVLASASANAFSALHLVNQVVRVVMTEGGGKALAEPTAERVLRRLGEVYLAVDALLSSGGVLEVSRALARARATLELASDKERDKDKAARAAEVQAAKAPAGRTQQRRTLQGAIEALSRFSFATQPSALAAMVPRPGFELQEAGPQGAVRPGQRALAPGQDPFALQGMAPAASTDPFGDDDIFGLAGGKAAAKPAAAAAGGDLLSDIDPFAPSKDKEKDKKGEGWQSFEGEGKDKKKDDKAKAEGFEGDAFGESPAFGTPLIPSEPVLRLSECWRGQVAGGRLLRAGLGGRVEWASEAAKSKVHTVQFLVQVPESGLSAPPLAAALSAARRHPAASRPGPLPGVLLGDGIQAKHHAGAPLLVYSMPATACQPPLQVHLGASTQALGDGRSLVTVGLHCAVSPRLAQRCAGLSVELTVPALLQRPLRAEPRGATLDGRAHVLRWEASSSAIMAGSADAFMAAFLVEPPPATPGTTGLADGGATAALAAALQRLAARVLLRGAERGGTLSGAGLAQGVVEMEETPGLCGWSAEVTATLSAAGAA